jgi:radical SAM protein with 4Fe4S-binding SPASM domain
MGNILRDQVRGPRALQVINRIEDNSKIRNHVCSTCYARSVCSACRTSRRSSSRPSR